MEITKPPEVRGGERRQRARHSPSALTYVTLGEDNGGIIANISESGMYVTAGQPLRESFFSRVSFKIPQTDGAIETQGEVVWTSESNKEAGVRFVELGEESRELIRKWVAPARKNGSRLARPAENSRGGKKQVNLTPPPTPTLPLSESASVEPAAQSNRDPAGAEPREVIPPATSEPYVPRDPERVPAAVARSIAVSEKDAAPLLAFSGLGPRAWELTETQRAEFERLFPSENASAAAHEAVTRETEIAAPAESQPIAERFAGYAASTIDAPREETSHDNFVIAGSQAVAPPAPAVESEPTVERETSEAPSVAHAMPPAANPRTPLQSLRGAPPPMMESVPDVARPVPAEPPTSRATFAGAVPRTPMQSLWDAPPPMMQPIIGGSYVRSYGSTYGAPPAELLEDRRPRSMWSVAAVTILVVAAFFLLGFLVGPDGMRVWPKVDAARGVVVAELGHLKSEVTSSGGAAGPNTGTAPAVSSNSAPSGPNAPASAPATPTAPAAAATGAPTLGEPATVTPAAPAPSATAPAAENSATGESASSASAGTDSDDTRDGADTTSPAAPAPKTKESTTAMVNKRDLEGSKAESAQAAREAEIEKERAAAAEAYAKERAAASATHEAAQPTTPVITSETSKPAAINPPRAEASSAAATHPSEVAPHPATPSAPPESYFPVVAPGAGNVPRLIELPEERIIDTAAVLIHSHQYVFVPAEPGPESSHALEKLQIGERITKIAPLYPAEAAQKAMGGTVHVRAIIGKDGRVEDVRPINGPLILITAAVDSILQWRYQPTLLEGQPIEVQEDFTVEFRPLGLH
ncbi:MAG: energy transducer TonB [Candidatus Acidiferrales bacterium]